jgi:hypothetical protein
LTVLFMSGYDRELVGQREWLPGVAFLPNRCGDGQPLVAGIPGGCGRLWRRDHPWWRWSVADRHNSKIGRQDQVKSRHGLE